MTLDLECSNPIVAFYKKHQITTDHHQSDLKSHLTMREKLYRTLGLPPIFFQDRHILDVGPGRGYNALAPFDWGSSTDFCEPNPEAQKGLEQLMQEHKIPSSKWSLYKSPIEEFSSDKTYDLVIAEGFIPGIYNRLPIIEKIKTLVKKGGVAVVTCMDDLSFLLELLRRITALRLLEVKQVHAFEEKVQVLAQAFSPDFKALPHRTRPVEDWIVDCCLCPSIYADFFSIEECLQEFGSDFLFYGASPSLFTDLSWYKNTKYDSQKAVLQQFHEKRHLLLLSEMPESSRPAEDNQVLASLAFRLRKHTQEYEKDPEKIQPLMDTLQKLVDLSQGIDKRISESLQECHQLLSKPDLSTEDVQNRQHIKGLFGKGVQYVSLLKPFMKDLYTEIN